RYAGCSNFMAWELAKALAAGERHGLAALASVQPRYNLLHRDIEMELLPLCRDRGLGVIVYNPLAGGMLSGKYRRGEEPAADTRFGDALGATATTYRKRYWREESLAAAESLQAFFAARGKALASVAVAWVLAQ